MFAVNFCASCFDSRENSVGKKLSGLDWEKAVYQLVFTLANTLLKNEAQSVLREIEIEINIFLIDKFTFFKF